MNLSGKSILLTGASSGIGYAVANKLSKENCKVAILASYVNLHQSSAPLIVLYFLYTAMFQIRSR